MSKSYGDLSIYLHIPFCTTKCTYCAFNTYTNLETLLPAFVDALIREINIVGRSSPYTRISTIFFGGGTPSLLTPDQFSALLEALHSAFPVQPDAEITLEANPNDLNRDYLRDLRARGLNRISIGMQTTNANELALFKRRHDNDEVAQAVSAARWGGFDNLNLDLIYGIPHQTLASWQTTITQMLALKPDHISLYALSLEEGTPMHAWVERGRLPEPDDDLAADMYDFATEQLAAAGYQQYEISNWALSGRECRHNLQYWRNDAYVGLGPGAHGFADGVRYSVILAPQRYIKLLNETAHEALYPFPLTPVTAESVVMDRAGEIAETLIMGLRLTREGISRAEFAARFGADILNVHGDTIHKYADYGLLSVDEHTVRLTERGRMLSNMIFRELV